MRSIVVLPQPEGPSIEKNSPRPDLEARVVDGDEVAVALADVLDRDDGRAVGCAHAALPLGAGRRAAAPRARRGRSPCRGSRRRSAASSRAPPRCARAARRASAGSRRSARRPRSAGTASVAGAGPVVAPVDVVAEERLQPLQVARAGRQRQQRHVVLALRAPLLEPAEHDVEAAGEVRRLAEGREVVVEELHHRARLVDRQPRLALAADAAQQQHERHRPVAGRARSARGSRKSGCR